MSRICAHLGTTFHKEIWYWFKHCVCALFSVCFCVSVYYIYIMEHYSAIKIICELVGSRETSTYSSDALYSIGKLQGSCARWRNYTSHDSHYVFPLRRGLYYSYIHSDWRMVFLGLEVGWMGINSWLGRWSSWRWKVVVAHDTKNIPDLENCNLFKNGLMGNYVLYVRYHHKPMLRSCSIWEMEARGLGD